MRDLDKIPDNFLNMAGVKEFDTQKEAEAKVEKFFNPPMPQPAPVYLGPAIPMDPLKKKKWIHFFLGMLLTAVCSWALFQALVVKSVATGFFIQEQPLGKNWSRLAESNFRLAGAQGAHLSRLMAHCTPQNCVLPSRAVLEAVSRNMRTSIYDVEGAYCDTLNSFRLAPESNYEFKTRALVQARWKLVHGEDMAGKPWSACAVTNRVFLGDYVHHNLGGALIVLAVFLVLFFGTLVHCWRLKGPSTAQ